MAATEVFCPWCEAVAEERGKTRSLLAPPGWYRCPDCLNDTQGFLLPVRKTRLILAGTTKDRSVRLLETIRGTGTDQNPTNATGDQNLATFVSKVEPVSGNEGSPGVIDIGTHMSNMTTTPTSIDHLVVRVHADVPEYLSYVPSLQPFVLFISYHSGGGDGEGFNQDLSGAGVDGWYEFTAPLAPTGPTGLPGTPWTKALVNDLDLSVGIVWDIQNPFSPGNLTLRVQEHEAEVWGVA